MDNDIHLEKYHEEQVRLGGVGADYTRGKTLGKLKTHTNRLRENEIQSQDKTQGS